MQVHQSCADCPTNTPQPAVEVENRWRMHGLMSWPVCASHRRGEGYCSPETLARMRDENEWREALIAADDVAWCFLDSFLELPPASVEPGGSAGYVLRGILMRIYPSPFSEAYERAWRA